MIKVDNLQLIGELSVDSGQAIIGDPCYLEDWKPWNSEEDNFEDHVNKVGEFGYLGACNATLNKGFGQLGGMSAVAFSTGYGDGLYPVYAHINDDGRVGMIVVDFTGEYGVDGE
jgi:hypothetical protein